jgi:hypothetical protein
MKSERPSRPTSAVICRIVGLPEVQCNVGTYNHLLQDPIVEERVLAVRKARPGWPDDPMLWNVFCSYKKIPEREEDGHLNFPGNFNLSDDTCFLAVYNKMSEAEREELRGRILDETLQATLTKIRFEGYDAFIAGDKSARANSDRRIAAAISEWATSREQLRDH